MDRQAVEGAFREFFATREAACGRLLDRLTAAGACDDTLCYELRLIQERSGAMLRIDMLYAIKRRQWLTRGPGRAATAALLASLHEAGTTDAQVTASQK